MAKVLFRRADLRAAIARGHELCTRLALRYGREWPAELAGIIEGLYADLPGSAPPSAR
jgi:hypothetical protein